MLLCIGLSVYRFIGKAASSSTVAARPWSVVTIIGVVPLLSAPQLENSVKSTSRGSGPSSESSVNFQVSAFHATNPRGKQRRVSSPLAQHRFACHPSVYATGGSRPLTRGWDDQLPRPHLAYIHSSPNLSTPPVNTDKRMGKKKAGAADDFRCANVGCKVVGRDRVNKCCLAGAVGRGTAAPRARSSTGVRTAATTGPTANRRPRGRGSSFCAGVGAAACPGGGGRRRR